MSPEDAEGAVGRHATSKIRSDDDLARVNTLDFEGEALQAIGAVSSLTLTTCESGATLGARNRVFAGEPIESGPAAHPLGMTVEMRQLFLTVPCAAAFWERSGPRRTQLRTTGLTFSVKLALDGAVTVQPIA